MNRKELLQAINDITKGNRFITVEQLRQIEELPYVYVEDCGWSGTGKGWLYAVYLMNEAGEKIEDEELCELVVDN